MSDHASSPEAGPSTYHQRPLASGTNGSASRTQPMSAAETQPRKKPRVTLDGIFKGQDAEERAKQGQQIRDMQTKLDDNRANVKNLKLSDLVSGFVAQDKVWIKVQDTGIGKMDAQLFNDQLDLVNQWTKEMHQNMNLFDVEEFLAKTKSLLGLDRRAEREVSDDDEEDELDEDGEGSVQARRRARGIERGGPFGDWEKIGWMAAKMSRRVTGVEFMYGPLAVEHKKRTQTQRQRRTQVAPEERPEEIAAEGKKEQDITLANVKKVHKALRLADPSSAGINFFRFAINPHSFGQSVENIFYISFLIRDNKAGIAMGEDSEVLVRYMEPPDEEQGGEVTKNQGVMEFDMETWELAKETFDIRESMIPHRETVDAAAPGARSWY